MEPSTRPIRRLGILASLLLLSPVLIGVPFYAYKQHTYLPEPVLEPYNVLTNQPQISESLILETSRVLSEEIGFRTPGTREHALGEEYLWNRVTQFKSQCDELVKSTPGRRLECEIWHQKGSGSHRFDMMGARLYKTYVDLGNIVVRLSDGTEEGKAHSVLVNAHLDSTLPTPGAADDAISVGIMLECIRVLVESRDWEPKNAIVFLFNNAEESLQDGSHLFSTKHEVASTVRAAINLEAAGTTGRELLFQATSFEMISAYSHVPRPHGTVVANDVFSSGIILSDTDFRQFQQYLNVTGLDIAVVGNSYLYHMRKDLVENIQPGVAQNFGENTLALLLHLSSSSSSISSLTAGFAKPQTVYFALFGRFWMYSFQTAEILYNLLFAASVVLVIARTSSSVPLKAPSADSKILNNVNANAKISQTNTLTKPIIAVLSSFLGALLGANFVALLMKYILGKPLSWFKDEYSTIVLYGPSAILGALVSQLFFSPSSLTEQNLYHSILLIQSFFAAVVQYLGIGSAGLLFLCAASVWSGLAVDPLGRRAELAIWNFFGSSSPNKGMAPEDPEPLSLLTYALALVLPLILGSSSAFLSLDVFVPLTGRLGADVPADNLIATIVVIVGAIGFGGFLIPFLWRFQSGVGANGGNRGGRDGNRFERVKQSPSVWTTPLGRAILLTALLSAVPIAVFSVREPFDQMHQKRVYFLRTENITSGEHHLHVSTSDGAPGFAEFVFEVAKKFGAKSPAVVPHPNLPVSLTPSQDNSTSSTAKGMVGEMKEVAEEVVRKPQPIIMDTYNSDWDPMYPFSLFLSPYKIPLPVDLGYVSPWSSAISSSGGGNLQNPDSPRSTNDVSGSAKGFAIIATNDVLDLAAGTRSLKLVIWHPGLIWTVIAFDAHVLSWSLDSNPPDEYTRHHVKEASYYGTDTWEVDMVVKLQHPSAISTNESATGSILVNFIGLEEEGMWPGKKMLLEDRNVNDSSLASLRFLSELDAWVEEETEGRVDPLLLGCIAGVQQI
ncbi:hypothetical protein GYMLUDRAFT_36677 [Collybiopsis luxurians FD-317 M1]|nr:hypothetical protein GYMLUDRAFT_36677 [Collybiopsis luxurians FD-317 M1]